MILAVALGACVAPAVGCGTNPRLGLGVLGPLRTEVPAWLDAETMAAAAETALTSRGYAIVGRSSGGTAEVVGERPGAPGRGWLERSMSRRASVSARPGDGVTIVDVRVDPFGDGAEATAVLESVLAAVGLAPDQR